MLAVKYLLVTLVGAALADDKLCQASNRGAGPVAPDPSLCLSQGPGSYTFTMEFPTEEQYKWKETNFYIYDESCRQLSSYMPPECDEPFAIEENWLPWVLTVTFFAENHFSFLYGDGEYATDQNQCICRPSGYFESGRRACRCAFPLNGHYVG